MEVIIEIVETYIKHKGTKKVYLYTITSLERAAHIFTQMFGDNSQEYLGIICLETTRKIRKACTQLDINLVDHLIINSKGEYYSLREHTPKEFSVS